MIQENWKGKIKYKYIKLSFCFSISIPQFFISIWYLTFGCKYWSFFISILGTIILCTDLDPGFDSNTTLYNIFYYFKKNKFFL